LRTQTGENGDEKGETQTGKYTQKWLGIERKDKSKVIMSVIIEP